MNNGVFLVHYFTQLLSFPLLVKNETFSGLRNEREIAPAALPFRLRSHYPQDCGRENCDHDLRHRGHAPVLFMDGANGRIDGQRLQGFVLQCILWPLSKGEKA